MKLWATQLALLLTLLTIPPQIQALSLTQIQFIPESERSLKTCVIGLFSDKQKYYFLPELKAPTEAIQEQFCWLDFELSHGALMDSLPQESEFFVAVAEADGPKIRDKFRRYLQARAGWSAQDLAQRLHYFKVPESLIWSQDATLGMGQDPQGRLVLADGAADQPNYRGFVSRLSRAYPQRFVIYRLPADIRAEGGDLAVVRRPDGRPGLILGRHRVLDYLLAKNLGDFSHAKVPRRLLKLAKAAYAMAYGLPVQVLPEAPLLEGWGSEDLFHLDMVAAFFSAAGSAAAAVPKAQPCLRDSISGALIPQEQRRAWAREFDAVAEELAQAGYKVCRPPMSDHPVRSPANVLKSEEAGLTRIYLARYPDPSCGKGWSQASYALQAALGGLNQAGLYWNQGQKRGAMLSSVLPWFWTELDRISCQPNPVAELQAEAYQSLGCQVFFVPDYPWGAGGLHCQFFH